jgi:hypothetical protein
MMASKELVPRPAVQPVPVITVPPWEQPKRKLEGASALRAGWRALRRNSHLSVPLTVPVALLAAGLVLHMTHSARYAAIVGAVLAAAVWYFAPHKWTKGNGEPRHREVWYARLSALLAAVWLWLAAWLGPVSGMPGLVLSAILVAAGSAWGFFWWRHKRPRGQRKRDALIAKWDAWWQSHCWHWNLGGSAIVNVWTMGVTVKVEVAGLAGRHSIQYVNQVLHLIESGLDGMVDVGRVRAETVKGRPNHFYLYFKQANPLAAIVEYDMAIAPRSVHDPAPLGQSETGSWKMTALRRNSFIIGTTRSGKALALDTRIPTPSGWTTMGEVKVGDLVFDELGQPCRVLLATDVMHGHDCYRVKFSDGSEITADAEHRWLVETRASRAYESATERYERRGVRGFARAKDALASWPKILTTEEMAGSLRVGKYANYSVPVAAPLQGADAELPIPPYTLGAWLGDGTSATGSLTTADPEIISEIETEGETVWRIACTVRAHCLSYRIRGLTARLGNAGLIGSKHIPVPYLRASESQRRSLLAGLLDTDGYCTDQGGAQYYSSSERLARDVHHLVATLGYKPTLRSKRAVLNGADCGIVWVVAFTAGDKVFRLPRKVARQTAQGAPATKRRFVVSIDPVPSVPVRCIAVDSPAHLYLAGESCIPTHNTNHLLVKIANLSGCPDARTVIIALKGGRSARPVLEAGGAEYVITTVDEARMYLRMLIAEVNARGSGAYTGDDQLHATAEIPGIWTEVDETHGLTSVTNGDAECARLMALLASQGSGVEMYLDVDTQYGSLEESVRTEQTRGNLGLRVVYRVEMASHGQFALEEWNKLDASKLEELGTCYVKDGPKSFPEQVRAPHMPHDLLKRITAQNAALMGARPALRLFCGSEMSPLGVTWQQWWDTRWLRLDERFREFSPQYQAAAADHPHEAIRVLADAAQAAAPPPSAGPGTGDGRSVAARIEAELAEIPVPDDWKPPKVDLRPVLVRQRAAFGDALAAAHERDGITPRQLAAESGMSTSWIHPMLAALAERGAIAQLKRGLYAAVPGADIHAAMALIEADRKRLLGVARQKISNAA